jgi:hypothetical protein
MKHSVSPVLITFSLVSVLHRRPFIGKANDKVYHKLKAKNPCKQVKLKFMMPLMIPFSFVLIGISFTVSRHRQRGVPNIGAFVFGMGPLPLSNVLLPTLSIHTLATPRPSSQLLRCSGHLPGSVSRSSRHICAVCSGMVGETA